MPYTAQYGAFITDKYNFFANVNSTQAALAMATQQQYKFLSDNQGLIEQEFNDLYASLQKDEQNREAFWLYSYYCALMLQAYYQGYNKPTSEEKYRQLSADILHRCTHGAFPNAQDDSTFSNSFGKRVAADLGKLVRTPAHTSEMRSWIGFANMTRIQLVFSRITISQLMLAARDLQWIDRLNQILIKPIDIDEVVSRLDATKGVFNLLSVGIFVVRFMINAGTLLKHTFAPTDTEKSLSLTERFSKELGKRYCDFLNDTVWGTVNGFTNYANYFNISAPVANWILAGFLFFDLALLAHRRQLAKNDYLLKQAQYRKEILDCQAQIFVAGDMAEMTRLNQHLVLLNEQLRHLETNWHATSATLFFNMAAAGLLGGSFSASLILTPVIAAPLCFFIGAIAVAMYISADAYGRYYEKSELLQQDEFVGKDISISLPAMQKARREFIYAIVKNATIPLFLITTFALSWPVAVFFTVAYMGYELGKGYFDSPNNPQGGAPALPPPPLRGASDDGHDDDDGDRLQSGSLART